MTGLWSTQTPTYPLGVVRKPGTPSTQSESTTGLLPEHRFRRTFRIFVEVRTGRVGVGKVNTLGPGELGLRRHKRRRFTASFKNGRLAVIAPRLSFRYTVDVSGALASDKITVLVQNKRPHSGSGAWMGWRDTSGPTCRRRGHSGGSVLENRSKQKHRGVVEAQRAIPRTPLGSPHFLLLLRRTPDSRHQTWNGGSPMDSHPTHPSINYGDPESKGQTTYSYCSVRTQI